MIDKATDEYYSAHASEVAELYDSTGQDAAKQLRRAFAEGMRVLDVGAGSGRDMSLLLAMGCNPYGVEPNEGLRAVALQRHPELQGRLVAGALPSLKHPFGGGFDGVNCSAVLMHLAKADIVEAAISLRDVLRDEGLLLLSIPLGRPDVNAQHRDGRGRLFTPLSPDYVQQLLERVGFTLVHRWESGDSLRRKGHTWCTLLLRAQHQIGSRPPDKI
jgi:SAM-dependent methyltransferase